MDPLFKIKSQGQSSLLPAKIVRGIMERLRFVREGVDRVEKAAALRYPPYYIEPVLPVASSPLEIGQLGAMFARTLPLQVLGRLEIWVQLSAPLVLFGAKPTIHAVLAHEFLHYVELARRVKSMDILSEPASSSIFESGYRDNEALIDARLIFKERSLINLMRKRFGAGLIDNNLTNKTARMWVEKGLPTVRITPESNIVKLPVSSLLSTRLDSRLRKKLDELSKRRKK